MISQIQEGDVWRHNKGGATKTITKIHNLDVAYCWIDGHDGLNSYVTHNPKKLMREHTLIERDGQPVPTYAKGQWYQAMKNRQQVVVRYVGEDNFQYYGPSSNFVAHRDNIDWIHPEPIIFPKEWPK